MAISHLMHTAKSQGRFTAPAQSDAAGRLTRATRIKELLLNRVKTSDVTFFTSQLALMLEVGTPMVTALRAIRSEVVNPLFKRALKDLAKEIEEGRQLSEAASRHGRIFDEVFISMTKAGETGGFLTKILERLVRMQEKRQALLHQLRTAMTYPLVLTMLGIGVVIFIMMGVLPKFTAIFQGKEEILPWSTRFLLAASDSLRHNWPLYLAGTTAVIGSVLFWLKTKMGRAAADRILIDAPIIKDLTNRVYTSETLRTLGYLLESGVPLVEALQVTAPTVRNRYYRRFIRSITESVSQGGRFGRPFSRNKHIPGTVKQMVTVGEEVGQLPKVMLRLARHYDTQVGIALKKFMSIVEPAALIMLGGIVGVIVSSIVLPLFRLSRALH